MFSRRTAAILALAAGVFFNVAAGAQGLDRSKSKSEVPKVTRVLILQGIDTREALTLVRSEAQVRQVVEIRDLSTIVVTGTKEVVDRCESLLRAKDVVVSSSVPHEPIAVERTLKSATKSRVFKIEGLDTRSVITVLRAMYGIRELKALDDENVRVRAKLPKLEAAEALLRELGVLVNVTEPEATPTQ